MEEKLRILILEDNAADAELMVHELGHEQLDFSFRCVETEDEFLKELDAFLPDLILADYTLPDFDAMHALRLVNERAPNIPVIIVTGSISEEAAVECMKAGAFDYVLKGHLIRLAPSVRAALDKKYEREQKLRAEKALRESEQRFRQLADSLPQLVWTCRSDGQCDYLSPRWVEYTGIPKAEQLGQGWLNQLHPDDREPTIALLNAATGASSFFEGEFRIRRHDGLYRWFKTRAVPLRSGEGRVVKWFGTNTDIETQKRAEGALRGSENKYRVLVENLPQKIFLKDRNSVYISCNENYARDLKIRPEEIAGKTDYDFYPEELAEKYRADDQRIMESGETEEIEEQYVQDGKELFVHTAKTPIRDEQGQVSGVLGIFWDITERRRAEEALRESEKKYRQLLETLCEGIWAIDASANTTFVNPQMAEMLGYTADEMLGRHLFTFMDEQGVEIAKRSLERRKAGIPEQHDFEFLRKDGTHIYARVDTSPLTDKEGNYAGALASVTDMTEQRQLEAALRKDEERLRLLFDNLTIGVYRTTPEGNILTANPVFVKMLGYASLRDLETRNLEEEGFNPTYPRSQFRELIEQKGEIQGFESAWHMCDGSVIYVQENARAVRGTDGKTLYYEGTAEDITERKQAEAELRETKDFLANLLDYANAPVIVWDAQQRITLFNHAFERMTGRQASEVIGKPLEILFPSDSRETSMAEIRRTIDFERWETVEIPIQNKDGGVRIALWNSATLLAADGVTAIATVAQGQDITEHKRVEADLRTSELRYRTLFEQAGDYVLLLEVTPEGEPLIIDANRAVLRTLGYSREEIVGKLIGFIDPDISPEVVLERERLVYGSETGATLQVRRRRKDGSVFLAESTGTVIRIGEKEVTLVIERDITERVRAEEALRESEQRFKAIFEHARDGIILADSETKKFLTGNPRICQMLGYSLDELKNLGVADIHPAEDLPHVIEEFGKQLRGEAEVASNLPVQRKDGSVFFADINSSPVTIDGSTCMVGVFRDITERKRAEEALRESEAKYRSLIDNSADAIYLLVGSRFEIINRSFADLFGVTPEEVKGPDFDFMQMVAPGSRALIEERSRMVDRGEEPPSRYEFTALGKDGKEIELEASVSRIDYGGGKATQGILRDITDRKKLEAQFRQAQKMEAIGALAGGIAHDFNNILAAMIGYAEMAQKQMPESNITARSDLDAVLEAGSRAKDLVKQILSFSRQTEQEPQLIRIYPVVKEALKFLRASLPTTIEIRENINTDGGVVIGDPTQIHQILMNLYSNALHAMREKGGVLEVQLDSAEVDAKFAQTHPDLHEGPYVVLTVSDAGQGMDQTTMERIFEPFYTTKAVGEGTGMGLSTTHGIVMSHNGAITVQSELGKGSTFRVYLPKVAVETPETVLEEEAISGGKENILFVDDEERLADLGKKMLESLGYNVAVRTSSIEALEVFRAQPSRFDLVITDQTMPKMTGVELATEMMRIRPDVPVILSTGYSAIVTPEKAKQVGIRECIMKPMLSAELGKAVRKVLDQDRGELRITTCILVIDDDPEVRSMLSDLLQRAGYEVIQCFDGRAAMKVLRERQINIVITDIIMPEKEGIETIQELQQEFPEVKIIAISGGGRIGPSNYLSLAKAFGVQCTFEKPLDNDEMLRAVHELLYV